MPGRGDSQITLTLGILCLARETIATNRKFVVAIGAVTCVAIATVRILADDDALDDLDGVVLVLLWLAGTALLSHGERWTGVAADGDQSQNRRAVTDLEWIEDLLRVSCAYRQLILILWAWLCSTFGTVMVSSPSTRSAVMAPASNSPASVTSYRKVPVTRRC